MVPLGMISSTLRRRKRVSEVRRQRNPKGEFRAHGAGVNSGRVRDLKKACQFKYSAAMQDPILVYPVVDGPGNANAEKATPVFLEDEEPRELADGDRLHRVVLVELGLGHGHAEEEDNERRDGAEPEGQPPDPFELALSKDLKGDVGDQTDPQ